MRFTSARLIGTLLLLCLAAGCEANRYRLEMSVEGEKLHRRLTCWRQTGGDDDRQLVPMHDSELQRIALAYGVEPPQSAEQEFTFSGEFTGGTPNDVGGAGSLTMRASDFGVSWTYVERFRGDDDLIAAMDRRRQAVDKFVDVLTDWLQGALGESADFEAVHAFVDETLRADLKNLTAYAWTAAAVQDATQSPEHNFEFGLRLALYAAERGYVGVDDVPMLLRSIEINDSQRLLHFVRSALAAQAGLETFGDEWRILDDQSRLEESLNHELQQHPGYLEFVRERRTSDPEAAVPPPTEYVGALALEMIGIEFGGFDSLEATLECPVEPYRTNGVWLEEEQVLSWERSMNPIDGGPRNALPSLLFAMWSIPSSEYQSAHFGRVILEDEALADYCLWSSRLSPAQQAQWNALIEALNPQSPSADWIADFHFAPQNGQSEELAEEGRGLLLNALQAE